MGFPIKLKIRKEGESDKDKAEKVRKELLIAKAQAELERRRANDRQALRDAKEDLKKQRARAGGTHMSRAKERFQKVGRGMQKVGSVMNKISTEGAKRSQRFADRTHQDRGFFGGGGGDRDFNPLFGSSKPSKKKSKKRQGFTFL